MTPNEHRQEATRLLAKGGFGERAAIHARLSNKAGTGEHYLAAEKILDQIAACGFLPPVGDLLATAHAHAELAQ